MGTLERHLDLQKVEQVLALKVNYHRHSSNDPVQPVPHGPLVRSDEYALAHWPTPAYRKRRAEKAARR